MSNITPSGQAFGAAASQATPVGVPGTVINPPPAVSGLAVGTILRGVVLSQDTQGHALVQTDRGALLVSSALALPNGSQVALQVRTAGSQLLIAILQIDGHPVHAPAQNQARTPGQAPLPAPAPQPTGQTSSQPTGQPAGQTPGQGPAPTPAAATAGPDDRLSLGQTLRAVVQAPAPAAPAGSGPLADRPPLAAGTRLQVVVQQVLAPATARAPAAAAPTSPSPAASPATGPATAPAAEPPPGGPGAPLRIEALVTGSTGRGQPVLQTALGTLTLSLQAALPEGTRLLLEVARAGLPGHQAPQAPARPAALAYHWPALAEALEALARFEAEARPADAAPQPLAAARGIPQPGARLASSILFFLQALGGGQLGGWRGGPAAEALERAGRGDLMGRLAQDFAQLARLSDSAGGDWRFLPLPFYDGQELHQLRLFLRRRQEGADGGEASTPEAGEAATRFVLDVDNSRFGELQLDGLVRDRRFDLILRSRRGLPEQIRRDIAGIFAEANGAAGGSGQIGFQASSDWQALPLAPDQPDPHIAPGLVV